MEENKQVKDTKQHNSEEEIDLGQLFSLIGKGFSKTFNFFGNIIKTLFAWVMSFVLFVKRNVIKIAVGAILGAVLGGVYQYGYKVAVYESSMTVLPNFGSTVQLYKNIDFYQSLVRQKDVERLASSLNISEDEAGNITLLEVLPYANENQTLLAFKSFTADLDSSTVKMINYEDFKEEQPVESFKYHIVTVKSKDKFVFSKLRGPIISSIIRNGYYDKVKTTAYSNLLSRKKAIESSMIELDTLRTLYKEVLLTESKKENSGTNIYMAQTGSSDKEVVVFDKYMNMNESLINVNKQLTEENEVINVVSSFNQVGMKVGGWYRNFLVIGFVLGFLLVLGFVSVIELNKVLVKYEDKTKQ